MEHLEVCLKSVLAQNYGNLEVIVVDNGSTDGSIEYVRSKFQGRVKLIVNAENVGFAKGNNIGFEAASGKYVIALNNDTEVDCNWVSSLVEIAEANRDVGMLASKILSFFNREEIDCVGHLVYPDGLSRGRGRGEIDQGQYDRIDEVAFPSGCAAFYRKEMLGEIGYFDDEFFIYVEDTDLGMRGRLAGWKCLYVPTAVVYHKYSATMGGYSPRKAFLVERNRIWFAMKNLPFPLLITSFYYTLMRYLLQAYGAFCHRGASGQYTSQFSKLSLVAILFKAYWEALRDMRHIIKKRRRIQRRRKLTNKEMRRLYKRFGISVSEIALKE